MCVLSFSTTLPEIFPVLRRIMRDIVINVHRSSCKVPAILFRFQSKVKILNGFSKHIQISDFKKIGSVFYADGQTDGHGEAI
jgi:hypothetical protein